jgi:hypothetical protein
MSTQGITTVDFGTGALDATTAITGQTGISSTTSAVDAWIMPKASASHSVDEHRIEEIDVMAGNIVNGVGFNIYAQARRFPLTGLFTVAWVWNG